MNRKRCFVVAMAAMLVLTGVSFGGEGKAKRQGGGAGTAAAAGIQKRDRLKDGTCTTPVVSAASVSTAAKTRDRLRDGSCLTPTP